jgi:hypothetical protein
MHKGMSFCLLILVMVLASCTTSQERAPDVSESVEPTAGQEATEAVVLPTVEEREEGSAEVVVAGALDKQVAEGTPTLIQLQDALDEPESYSLDVPGFGASLDLTGALTAHTCKPNADDEYCLRSIRQRKGKFMRLHIICVWKPIRLRLVPPCTSRAARICFSSALI